MAEQKKVVVTTSEYRMSSGGGAQGGSSSSSSEYRMSSSGLSSGGGAVVTSSYSKTSSGASGSELASKLVGSQPFGGSGGAQALQTSSYITEVREIVREDSNWKLEIQRLQGLLTQRDQRVTELEKLLRETETRSSSEVARVNGLLKEREKEVSILKNKHSTFEVIIK